MVELEARIFLDKQGNCVPMLGKAGGNWEATRALTAQINFKAMKIGGPLKEMMDWILNAQHGERRVFGDELGITVNLNEEEEQWPGKTT